MSRYLGQHFLKNKAKLRKIVDALELKNNDVVIEIGPGHGELTKELRSKNYELRIVAVEKDKELYEELVNSDWRLDKNIEFIYGDALKIIPELVANYHPPVGGPIANYKLVGNIPYYITGYLFRILGELEYKPELIVLLIQKEVAKRICVGSSTRRRQDYGGQGMNLLAASIQFWAEPKIIDNVPRGNFNPVPKVDSAIIKLRIKNYELRIMNNYYKFIKILFKQPRKTIVNNLVAGIMNNELRIMNKEEIIGKLNKVGVEPKARPQNLKIEQIIELSTLF